MSYSTQVFFYFQRQIVVLLDGTSPRSYMPFYSKTLKIHKGVDNQLQFQFLNQAQKPIDITGKEIVCRIISSNASKTLIKKALDLSLPATGIAVLNLGSADLLEIDAQKCYYSLEFPQNSNNYPVIVDGLSAARGDMEICDSVLPNFVPSVDVTIPSDQLFPDPTLCDFMSNIKLTYYTSAINTMDDNALTFQASFREYSGNVTVEGSTLQSSGWYPITEVYQYTNLTDTIGYPIKGYHPWVRIKFESSYGWVTDVKVR